MFVAEPDTNIVATQAAMHCAGSSPSGSANRRWWWRLPASVRSSPQPSGTRPPGFAQQPAGLGPARCCRQCLPPTRPARPARQARPLPPIWPPMPPTQASGCGAAGVRPLRAKQASRTWQPLKLTAASDTHTTCRPSPALLDPKQPLRMPYAAGQFRRATGACQPLKEHRDRKSTRLNSSHERLSRMPSSA